MQLWTDYEGVTIDGAFPLQKLLMPEGRSAFYSTCGPDGEPTVVRLIECHFDEEEILARWRCIAALNHPHFLKFERFGQTKIDGHPVVYAVIEKVDANLAAVLDTGSLSVKDVAQIASSLVAALGVLHVHGFIHEHVEPRNIFALGDVVKLRSDCIREAPEGEEGRAAKRRDVHDLATVLLQSLTQHESLEGVVRSALPAPFDAIIRNGIDGTWDLDDIQTALDTHFAPAPAATPEAALPAPSSLRDTPATSSPSLAEPQLSLPRTEVGTGKDRWADDRNNSPRSRWPGAAAVAALLLLFFGWMLHSRTAHQQAAPPPAALSQAAAQATFHGNSTPAPQPAVADQLHADPSAAPASRTGWHVIAFTYNRRSDAEKKVADLARTHPRLEPEVFALSGHAPYFVSLGGAMDRDAAYSLARRSRSLGLPRDVFAKNFTR